MPELAAVLGRPLTFARPQGPSHPWVHAVAAEIGNGGAARLKSVVTESVNEFLRPIRERRAELDRGHLRRVLERGNERANAVAERTLDQVRAVMA
ncbi:hypothetical protein GCM10010191_43430 [Actinomadura vinacea]|uniref:Tryptophan--tRNA ligase n=1 Tax=Actinomadura vinacea TaxID=115336 RepID=A0ABN3JDM6_9ACTN